MPELPEVETVRRDLEAVLVGRRVTGVRVTGARTVRRPMATALAQGLPGRLVVAVGRRGKYLVGELDDGALVVVHLRMSGQLRYGPATEPTLAHTHVVVVLDGGDELRFVDPRTFGEVFITRPERLEREVPDLIALGPDALTDLASGPDVAQALGGRRRQLKALLTDQRVVAGIGNIYADEILHRAGLHPERRADSLRRTDFVRLQAAMVAVLSEAIEHRGSSLSDEQYVDLAGRPGGFQVRHRVHARAGQPCPTCGTAIVRGRSAGRSTYWCPRCQRRPRT